MPPYRGAQRGAGDGDVAVRDGAQITRPAPWHRRLRPASYFTRRRRRLGPTAAGRSSRGSREGLRPTPGRRPPAAAAADCTLDVTNCLRNGRHLARRPPSHVSLSPSLWVPGAHRHLSNTDANDSFNTRETCRLPDPRHRKQFRPASAPIWQPHARYSSDQACRCFLRPFPIRFFCIQSISNIRRNRYIMIDQSIRNCLKWP